MAKIYPENIIFINTDPYELKAIYVYLIAVANDIKQIMTTKQYHHNTVLPVDTEWCFNHKIHGYMHLFNGFL